MMIPHPHDVGTNDVRAPWDTLIRLENRHNEVCAQNRSQRLADDIDNESLIQSWIREPTGGDGKMLECCIWATTDSGP
jgi:hypothetical protein